MTNEEKLAREYAANEADVSTSTSLLRVALKEIDRLRREAQGTMGVLMGRKP